MSDLDSEAQSFDKLWALFGQDFGLLPELGLDAVLARYRQGETACVPRLAELVCTGATSPTEAAEALLALDLSPLSPGQCREVEVTLDRWWLRTLLLGGGYETKALTTLAEVDATRMGAPLSAIDVLGVLAGFAAPMSRWLRVWFDNFDGPGAQRFVDAVLADDGPSEVWQGKEDQWVQFETWCRLEATVMGFTLVGAYHVEADDVTAVLDRLV